MTIYEERQLAKKRMRLYREAAAKKLGLPVNLYGNVAPVADGAFVEVQIWVPLTDIEIRCPKHDWPIHPDEACQKCIDEDPVLSGKVCICTHSCRQPCDGSCGCKAHQHTP